MNILVTGANGQLGNELRVLAPQHSAHTFFFTDVAELDITNEQAVRHYVADHRIGVVVNCAAYTAVDKAQGEPQKCDQLNRLAPTFLAKAAQEAGAALIQISTDYVFDGRSHLPYTEDYLVNPLSIYGKSKALCEKEIVPLCAQTVIIRTSWLYSSFGSNFIKTMIRLGKERDHLGVVFDQIGTPTYAADLASAICHIIEKGIQPGLYHYSNEGVCSWYDFALAIHRLAGITSCRVEPLHTYEYPMLAPRPHFSVLDKTKIKKTYGLSIPHWYDSLKACIEKLQTEDAL